VRTCEKRREAEEKTEQRIRHDEVIAVTDVLI